MIDTTQIRKDFPQYADDANRPFCYLDNAATSLTPTCVLEDVDAYYKTYRANVHRGIFREAARATEAYENVRTKVATFIDAASPKEVIFTAGATDSSNMLVRMLEASGRIRGKANIVTTEAEHHGALVPLQELALRAHTQMRIVTIDEATFHLDYKKAEEFIDENTAIVSVVLASNVTGAINDVRRIADIAHRHGAIVLVDATAAMGHIPVSVRLLGADALYFSGHKMFAPTGVGVLWVKSELLETLPPSSFGGHMVSRVTSETAEWAPVPERFEAGTKNIGGVIGLGRAIDYIVGISLSEIHKHNAMLAFYAIHTLEQIEGVKVFSPCDPEKNIGIVSFTCDFAHPHDVAEILARDNVAVRPGHHCAMPLHEALGAPATIRASFHVYNTKADVDALVEGVKKAQQIFS